MRAVVKLRNFRRSSADNSIVKKDYPAVAAWLSSLACAAHMKRLSRYYFVGLLAVDVGSRGGEVVWTGRLPARVGASDRRA